MLANLIPVGQLHTAGARRLLTWAQPPKQNFVATDYAEERVRAREGGPFRAPSWSFIYEQVEEFKSQRLGRRSFIKQNAQAYSEKILRAWDKLVTEAKELAQDFEDTDCAIHKFQHMEGGFALFEVSLSVLLQSFTSCLSYTT